MKLLFRTCLALALLTLATSSVFAQVATSYTLTIFNGATVVSTTVITAANFSCGQTPLSGPSINPRHVEFTDPANAAQVCLFTDNGTNGPLSSLPFGATAYTATLIATNSAGSSAPSAPSPPFTEPGQAPGAPMVVKVVQ